MKKCPFCNSEMPEEAHICLNCLNICEEAKESAIISQYGGVSRAGKKRFAISRRALSNIITAAICVFVVLPCMIFPQLGSSANQGVAPGASPVGNGEKGDGSIFSRITTAVKETLGIEDENPTVTPDGSSLADSATANGIYTPSAAGGNDASATQGSSAATTTEASTSKQANRGSSASNSAEATTTIKPEDESIPEGKLEYDKWDYTEENSKLRITKYTGSAKTVIIPDEINGKKVSDIDENTFLENNTMQYAVFKDFSTYHTLWIHYRAFNNCGNLKKIVFPKNADLGIAECFAAECCSLYDIQITSSQYKFVDGALIYYNSNYWQIYYYCEGYKSDTFTYPEYIQVAGSFNLFKHTKNLKSIYLSSELTDFLQQYDTPYLEAVYANGNSRFKDVNGVLFKLNGNGKWALLNYPNNNRESEFTMPENCVFTATNLKNSNLKTIKIPASAQIDEHTLKYICRCFSFPNLQTIYVENGSDYTSYIKSTFTGKVVVY